MHRIVLALTIAALAGFSPAVHAHDGAAPRSTAALPHAGPSHSPVADRVGPPQTMLAKLDGKGEDGQPCHATYGDRAVDRGAYGTVNNELACHDAHEWILCHKEDTSEGPDKPLCVDGYKE